MLKFLRKLFQPREPRANRDGYQPRQREPREYIHWLLEFAVANQEGRLQRLVIAFGFPMLEFPRALKQVKQLGLNCSSVRGGPRFERRNPVVVCRYTRKVKSNVIVSDAQKVRDVGATDVSAVGIAMNTLEGLRRIFGSESCPVLAASVEL